MEAVQSQFGLEFAVAVGHARRDVDVDLRVDVVVDFGNGAAPVIGRILVEGGLMFFGLSGGMVRKTGLMPWLRHFFFSVCKSAMTSPAGTPARRLLEPMRMMTYEGLKGRTSRRSVRRPWRSCHRSEPG